MKLICNLDFKLAKMKRDKALDTVKELPKEFELEKLLEWNKRELINISPFIKKQRKSLAIYHHDFGTLDP